MKRLNPDAFNRWVYDIVDDYTHRVEVYYGGAGSGKSHGALQKILLKGMNRRRRVLVIRKVGKTIKESVFALMRQLLAESGQSSGARVNKSDFEIELANGTQFLFKGLDDPEKIKSIFGVTDIVIEEATELTQDDFMQLNLRLRPQEPDPQIYLMFNPVSKANWVYSYFFLQQQPGTLVINSTYTDNRFLPSEYIAELERLRYTSPAYYRIYALGEFATLDKLVFPIIHKRLIAEDEIIRFPLWVGLDFGYVNDPSALTWGHYDGAGKRIYITGDYSRKGMTNAAIAQTIKALGLSKEIIIADREIKSIDELRRDIPRIRPADKGPDSIMHGIDFMLRHEIVVDERCVSTIEELENYTWKKDKKTGEYVNEPIDTFNHNIDAARYGLEPHSRRPAKVVTVRER